MIISCPNCSTKYNFPDDRIGEDGVDVRCARCKHEFHVDAPGHEDAIPDDIPSPNVTYGEDSSADDDLNQGLRADDFDVPDEDDKQEPSGAEQNRHEPDDDAASERDTWEFPKEKAEAIFTGAGFSLEDFGDKETEDSPHGALPFTKSRLIALAVSAIGFLGIIFGGLYMLEMWPFRSAPKIPVTLPAPAVTAPAEVEQPQTGEPESKKPEKIDNQAKLVDTTQFYLKNDRIGEMLVITGKVMNITNGPREMYKLEATLFDANKKALASKQFLAGNKAALFQLKSMSKDELESTLNSRVGQLTNNTNVLPGGLVEFMVVFYNPPQNLNEYLVRVVEVQEPLRAKQPTAQPGPPSVGQPGAQ